MRNALLATFLLCLCVINSRSNAQGLPPLPPGGYYVPCPYGLSSNFFRGYGGVPYQGYEFDAEWRSSRADFPLPPLNWYYPIGMRDIPSRDGRAIWRSAQLRVMCWIYNALDIVIRHYDPIAYQGRVEECGNSKPGNTGFAEYDPYDPYGPPSDTGGCSSPAGNGGSGGSGTQYHPGDSTHGETVDWATGMGNGGYSACGEAARVEYICIDVWNDAGQKWDSFSCGYATTC